MWANWQRWRRRARLTPLMNGELSAGEAAALEAAIAADPRLQAEYRRLQNALAVARQLPAESLPESFRAAMQAELDLLEHPLREQFSDLIDGTLSASEADRCRAAIAAVPGLAAELAWVEHIVASCHDWPDQPLPAGFTQQLTAELDAVDALRADPAAAAHRAPAGQRRLRALRPLGAGLRPRPLRLAWAGLLVLVLGFGSISVRHLPRRGASEAEMAATSADSASEPAHTEAARPAVDHSAAAMQPTEAGPASPAAADGVSVAESPDDADMAADSHEAATARPGALASPEARTAAGDGSALPDTHAATRAGQSPPEARPVTKDGLPPQEARPATRHESARAASRTVPRVVQPAPRETRTASREVRPASREVRPASREVRTASVMRPGAGTAEARASRVAPRAAAPSGPVAVPRPAPVPTVREVTLPNPTSLGAPASRTTLGAPASRTTPAAELPAAAPAARASLVPTAPSNPTPAPEPAATPERRPWFQVSLPPRERPTMVATAAPEREIPSPRLLNRHAASTVALDFTPAPAPPAAPAGPAFEVEGGGQAD